MSTNEASSLHLNNPVVNVEYCGACDYSGYCLSLSQTIKQLTPNSKIYCKRGRQENKKNKIFYQLSLVIYKLPIPCAHRASMLVLDSIFIKIVTKSIKGSFEVEVNDKLVYSKLQTMALPDFDEVSEVVNNVSKGEEPVLIKGQQPIDCVIS